MPSKTTSLWLFPRSNRTLILFLESKTNEHHAESGCRIREWVRDESYRDFKVFFFVNICHTFSTFLNVHPKSRVHFKWPCRAISYIRFCIIFCALAKPNRWNLFVKAPDSLLLPELGWYGTNQKHNSMIICWNKQKTDRSFSVVYAHKYLTNFQITLVDNQFSNFAEYEWNVCASETHYHYEASVRV